MTFLNDGETVQEGDCMYKTVIFFLPESGLPDLIPHQEYVGLVRGDASTPKYAKQQVRIADWYIKMDGNQPIEVENETYSLLNFDEAGRVAWPSESARSNASNRLASSLAPHTMQAHGATKEGNLLHKNNESLTWLPTLEERTTLHEIVFQSKKQQ
jgi:hypothetical protein